MPSQLAVLNRMETRLLDQPAQSIASIRYSATTAGSAPINSSIRNFLTSTEPADGPGPLLSSISFSCAIRIGSS